MKRLLTVAVTLLVFVSGEYFMYKLLRGIQRGKFKRELGEILFLAEALERFRCANGSYPGSFADPVFSAPENVASLIRSEGETLAYFSNGFTYTLLLRQTGSATIGAFELRDGRWVTWPDLYSKAELVPIEQQLALTRLCKP